MEQGMNLSGQLGDWTVDDLIQIVRVTKKTGSLDIKGDRKGRIHFADGLLTGAELHSHRGVYAGTDAETIADVIFVLGGLEAGTFAMGAAEGPDSEGHEPEAISANVDELRKLEQEISESGVLDGGEINFVPTVTDKVVLDPASWQHLARLIPPITIDELEERFGRGSSVRMVHYLNGLGVLALAPAEDDISGAKHVAGDESGWLEELADGVSPSSPEPWEEDEDEVHVAINDSIVEKTKAGSVLGVAADASTTLTGGVYDDIRRLRSKPS